MYKNVQVQIKQEFLVLNKRYLKLGAGLADLEKLSCAECNRNKSLNSFAYILPIFILFVCFLYQNDVFYLLYYHALGIRCVVPNNYFVWEATRPISDCSFCINVTGPIVLYNATREEFTPYAYTSKPMVIKKAFLDWPAMKYFDFYFFKQLYESVEGSYESVDEECQFLHFQSNFISIRDVFKMDEARVRNEPGQQSWYVGWGNCHPEILGEMRRFYPKPRFLPEDCEIPSKEYVFMGYDAGATMHLDFINRLMWQAQLKGSKMWNLVPSPECQQICHPFSFLVEPGDAVLVDTRVWYHGTTIKSGEFSLSVQSEYG